MKETRSYASPVREEQARLTRLRVLAAAEELFVAGGGYAGTTIAQVAAAAGVSGQTVYNVFGSKAALLKEVYDVRLAGDDQAIPMVDRPEMQALRQIDDPRAFLAAYARVGMGMLQRVGPLMAMVQEGAAAGDPDLRELMAVTGRERRVGSGGAVGRVAELGALRADLTRDEAVELVWTMISFEVWDLLVRRCGWSAERYAEHVGRLLGDAVLA